MARLNRKIIGRARANLEGYARAGAAHWPGASHFTLILVADPVPVRGSAADICPDCVRVVAAQALAEMSQPCRPGALAAVRPVFVYGIVAHHRTPPVSTLCAECGRTLLGEPAGTTAP